MKIALSYFAQVRQAAGVETETLDVPDGSDLAAVITEVANLHSDELKALVLDDDGNVRPSILLLLDGAPVSRGTSPTLAEGSAVSIFSAVAGG